MAITPQTNLFLLKCPIGLNNKNQLTFSNPTSQHNYFALLPKLEVENISYQRHNNIIRYPEHIDNLLDYNYCMYQNENYGNKWFYAFITNMTYINDNRTDIQITTDVYQTWQFNIQFLESFIEREMINPNEDIAGSNLIPENLELGEPIINGESITVEDLEQVNVIAYSGDKFPKVPSFPGETVITYDLNQGGYTINGVNNSIVFILITDNTAYSTVMNALQQETFSDYIISCFTVPKLAVKSFLTEDNIPDYFPAGLGVYFLQNPNSYYQNPTSINLGSKPTTIDGYTPINKKLLTYPYNYLGFNPANSSQKIYRYEDFGGNLTFNIISEVNPNPTVYVIPQNYRKSNGNNLIDVTTISGYPTLSSRNDFFNSWLAQNGNIISLQMQQEQFNYEMGQVQNATNFAGNLISQIANLDVGGALTNSLNTGLTMASADVNHEFYIKNQMAQIEKQKLLPDKVNLSGSNATLLGYNLFNQNIFTKYSIKEQFAKRIDKYFNAYGYATNLIKLPNLNNRPNWNYVKTTGANILGNIPQRDLQIIKDIFNNGVTLWHNPSTFGDYSQNNK